MIVSRSNILALVLYRFLAVCKKNSYAGFSCKNTPHITVPHSITRKNPAENPAENPAKNPAKNLAKKQLQVYFRNVHPSPLLTYHS